MYALHRYSRMQVGWRSVARHLSWTDVLVAVRAWRLLCPGIALAVTIDGSQPDVHA